MWDWDTCKVTIFSFSFFYFCGKMWSESERWWVWEEVWNGCLEEWTNYIVRFLGTAKGLFKLCTHKSNVKLVSTGDMFYCSHIQLFKGIEQPENWMQENQSFIRRVWWKESDPIEVRAHERKWLQCSTMKSK